MITLFWVVMTVPALLLIEPAQQAGLRLAGLDGTIWSGSAKRLRFTGRSMDYTVTDVRWHLQPSSLLRGTLCFAATSGGQGDGQASALLSGTFCMSPDGTVAAVDVKAELPAATLLLSDYVQLQGTVLFTVNNLAIARDGAIEHFVAHGVWLQAGAAFGNDSTLDLGDLAITGQHSGRNGIGLRLLSGTQQNVGLATLDLQYQIELDRGVWQATGVIAPGPDISPVTRDWLATLTEADAHGTRRIDWRGP